MDVAFYHLITTPVEKALPKLVEKIYASGLRSLIVCDNQERMLSLNSILWTFSQNAFIPHNFEGDPARHPVWLSLASDNVNQADVALVLNGAMIPSGQFSRVMDMFDGNDETSVVKARERYKSYRDGGYKLTYWKQNEKGAWASQ